MREYVYKVENINAYLRHENINIYKMLFRGVSNDDHHAIASRAADKVEIAALVSDMAQTTD